MYISTLQVSNLINVRGSFFYSRAFKDIGILFSIVSKS